MAAVNGAEIIAISIVVQNELQAEPRQWMPNSFQPTANAFT